MKDKIYYIATIILLWIGITTIIQSFKCRQLTQTELFLNIPKSSVFKWHNCSDTIKFQNDPIVLLRCDSDSITLSKIVWIDTIDLSEIKGSDTVILDTGLVLYGEKLSL